MYPLGLSVLGIGAAITFVLAYAAAMAEERLRVRKSVPMLLAAGLVWILVGVEYATQGRAGSTADAARRTLLDFAELMLFLIPAMTFVNTLEERGLFDVLQGWLATRGLSLRTVFWLTGALAFTVSPLADNLTTALLLGGVVVAVGRANRTFVALACINVVVAANAGGTFSPFGDITTLMVWQAGRLGFTDFFALFLPALTNWLVPGVLLSLHVHGRLPPLATAHSKPEPGALPVLALFLATIALTVVGHTVLDLPPALGMMAGLALLKTYAYVFNLRHPQPAAVYELDEVIASQQLDSDRDLEEAVPLGSAPARSGPYASFEPDQERELAYAPSREASVPPMTSTRGSSAVASPTQIVARPFDTFALLAKIEWDTLMFFYGVLLCVGGLGAFGYLTLVSQQLYGGGPNPTLPNVAVGVVSALIDNVPVTFAVLNMNPAMSQGQWLLVTLTAGVGGSLLSIGSAAGVGLMGAARGTYTFATHLRWSWAIALGYAASIAVHLLLNARLFA